jgi:hypothetical protein
MVAIIAGEQFWLWCTIDEEGEVLDQLAQRRPQQGHRTANFMNCIALTTFAFEA